MPPPEGHEQSPQELAADQHRRELIERARAGEAIDDVEARAHERRSEKAGYLREKLEQQVESEHEVDGPAGGR